MRSVTHPWYHVLPSARNLGLLHAQCQAGAMIRCPDAVTLACRIGLCLMQELAKGPLPRVMEVLVEVEGDTIKCPARPENICAIPRKVGSLQRAASIEGMS